METLSKTQNAADFVSDINTNLAELGSQESVEMTDSAATLASTLNTALGVDTLDADDNAEDFVTALNTAFADAQDVEPEVVIPGIDRFNKTKFGTEMDNAVSRVEALKDTADLILMVSTDLHHEEQWTATIEKNGETYENVPLYKYSGGNMTKRDSSFAPLMSNQNEFLRRARQSQIKVDAIVCLGDVFDGWRIGYSVNGTEVLSARDIVSAYVGLIMQKFINLSTYNHVPLLMAVGNHDDNWDSGNGKISDLTYTDLYNWYLKDTVDVGSPSPMQKNAENDGVDYYVDFDEAGIRVVVLFDDTSATSNKWAIGQNSVDFLKECTGEISLNGRKVLVLSHIHPNQSAYYTDKINGNNGIMGYIQSKPDTFIGYICGHDHEEWVCGYPVASIALACNKPFNANENDVWSIIAIDKTSKIMSLVRFDKDRRCYGRGWVHTYLRSYKIHYEQEELTINETTTIRASIDNVTSWSILEDSWFAWVNQTETIYQASDYVSIEASQDLLTCDVSVIAQDTTYPQCVTIQAYSSVDKNYEYWFIRIPKLTT